MNARVELERQLNGGSYGRNISANALHNLGGGHTKDRPSVEPQLLVTPLGFGVDDVRVNSKTAAALRAKKSNVFSGIHVETE